MIVAHVGPPPRRVGGPAGYLHQLKSAASADQHPRHDVRFPAASSGPARPPSAAPALDLWTRVRRRLFGPRFYRPSHEELQRPAGLVDRMLSDLADAVRQESAPSLDASLGGADVIFTHDSFSAETALARRAPGQQVWLLCHGVTPMALYIVWSWAVPEADWRSLLEYQDVRRWIDWEIDVWGRVDRLIVPCPEATQSFRAIDSRYESLMDRAYFLLSGAAAPPRSGAAPFPRPAGEANRLGLYLGSPEPYRGFDALVAAVEMVPGDSRLTIAIAGPDPSKVPIHHRLMALGRVEDVFGLLQSVDFLINVNRFNLFDLSTIEAAEAGKPLLLHAVGGNRAFERLGAGCVLIRNLEPATIAASLTEMAGLPSSRLDALGQASRECWEQHLTPGAMWRRHLDCYDDAAR